MAKANKSVIIPRSVKVPADLNDDLNEYLDIINESFSGYVVKFIREDIGKNLAIKALEKAKRFEKKYAPVKKKKA